MHNSVGVNVECDLDLRQTPGCWGNALKVELTEHLIVCSHLSLSLKHLDAHLRLVVGCSAEDLGLLGWDGCVPVNDSERQVQGCVGGVDTNVVQKAMPIGNSNTCTASQP